MGFLLGVGVIAIFAWYINFRKLQQVKNPANELLALKTEMQNIHSTIEQFSITQAKKEGAFATHIQNFLLASEKINATADRLSNTLIRGGSQQQGTWGEFVLSNILDTIGWMNMLQGNTEVALQHFRDAVDGASRISPETYDHLGDAYWTLGKEEDAIQAWETAASVLFSQETRQAAIDGYSSRAFSVWGISVATPEALYDLEIGSIVRNLHEKLTAVQEGKDPFEPKKHGAR